MPSTAPDIVLTPVDTAVVFDPLANDEGTGLVLDGFGQPAHGTLIANPDGTLTYTPAPGFVGSDSFTYTIRDATGATASGTVTISVLAPNRPPVANDDEATLAAGTAMEIQVLANDGDPDGDTLRLDAISQPLHGTASFLAPDRIRYRPQPGFSGIDRFLYMISDGHGGVATGTVTVRVADANRVPVAADFEVETLDGTPLVLDLLARAQDPDGDRLRLEALSVPHYGRLTVNSDRTVTYTPQPGWSGTDSFRWTVGDGHGGVATGTVRVRVVRPNRPPAANDDTLTTPQDTPVAFAPLANDGDPDGDPVRLVAFSLPRYGRLSLDPDGRLVYTPDPGFVGEDRFTYTIDDGRAGGATGTVRVTVTPAEPPAELFANGFRFRRRILLPARQTTSEVIEGFVLFLKEEGDWLKAAAHGGQIDSPEGFDIRFELEDGTKLPHEIEHYDPLAGRLLAWVRIPHWDLAATLCLFLYYGKPGLVATEAEPAATWQDHLAVWDPRTGQDRSGRGRDLIPAGVLPDELVGPAGRFDGTADLRTSTTDWLVGLTGLTVVMMVRPDREALGSSRHLCAQGVLTAPDHELGLSVHYSSTGFYGGALRPIVWSVQTDAGIVRYESRAEAQIPAVQVLHMCWSAGAYPAVYLDGRELPASWLGSIVAGGATRGMAVGTRLAPVAGGPLSIGIGGAHPARAWKGSIGLVRVLGSALAAKQIAAEAQNQLSPEDFRGIGDAERPNDGIASPVALPISIHTRSNEPIDIDVLARVGAPAGTRIIAIETPAHGTASLVDNRIRYAPFAGFVGVDQFDYTLGDKPGDKERTSTGSIRVTVESRAAEYPAPLREYYVRTRTELDAALMQARPGDHIILANGNYGNKKLAIQVSGTARDPIVIRAANVLEARLPGGFDYAVGTSHVWLWGLDFKDAVNCGLRGHGHVVRRCRIWPKPNLAGGAMVAIKPEKGSHCRIDYCELRLHTTAEVQAEFGSTNFQSGTYACVRTYNSGPTSDWFRNLTIERCLLTGGLSGLPYRQPNQQFIEDDGPPSQTYHVNVDWIIANCYGNVTLDAAVFDLKVGGMHVYKCHIDGPAEMELQLRQGQNSVVDRVRFAGRIAVVNPNKKVLNSKAHRIDIMAGNIPYGSTPGTNDRVQPRNTWIVNCHGNLKIGFQADTSHIYPALNTLVGQHTGRIDRIVEQDTTINPRIERSTVTPADPVTMTAVEVGPLAPWVGTEY